MADAIHNAISILLKQSSLTENEMEAAILQVMDGNASAIGLGMLLTALRFKGESVDEIVGAARALRERAIRVPISRRGLLDTCGTGGDELNTFNVSTATAFVTAACGVPVAKHSNRGVSSRSGSADVLEALGVRIDLTPEEVARAVDEIGLGFCFAPLVHGAMKYAAPVRKQLGFRTIFNLLGPLTNPAAADFQLIGTGRVAIAHKIAEALARLGTTRALVVCGNDELDEVSLWGQTTVLRVEQGKIEASAWTAGLLGLPECSVAELRISTAAESAQRIRDVFSGVPGAARNIVLANAAAALIVAQRSDSPREAVALAAAAIDSGKTTEILKRLTDFPAKHV